ncbi:hypothetical protein TG4357_03640 [Thalassovita gelatinovora]|uniref:Uncharacterized protein n=1 Tax=Thalassovita gelatinovora TaxID=53501 RepID=A0A0P1FKG0_THAGE|nr:hypothetical protein [Thalassovita gelatinovora]QIZ78985.1 hypothetical protein HFZ77_00085 [Thalassovita gelatinovora]CUH68516.1 hypothetical protein TG4357_03640 [Thalassovita gelatinovora]SEQ53865.1 hypothetical protein SAMN04488043_106101 [Thalassovita gelatinovora]
MKSTATCQRCQWLRAFLAMGFALIALIGMQPEAAQIVASMMPAPLALAVGGMFLGSLAFFFRLWVWVRITKAG